MLSLHRQCPVEKERLNILTQAIIGSALEVHRELGPGLLEQAYEACLAFELPHRGSAIERQKLLPLVHKGHALGLGGYRLDRFASCRVGLLFNFNVKWLTEHGLKRVVNGFPD